MSVNVIDITSEAYALPVLHAFRFPHATVNGILLGHAGVAGGRPSVAEAVPLFHRHLELTAMLEVALNMVSLFILPQDASLDWRHGYFLAGLIASAFTVVAMEL